MVISYLANGTVSIKTKTETITLAEKVQIGSHTLPGAGEYDIAAIQCEAHHLTEATVYFFHSEDLHLSFLDSLSPEVTQMDDASNTNILIVDVRSDQKVDQLKSIIKSIEPSYLFLSGAGATPEFRDALHLPLHDSSSLKIVRSGLPLEGTFLVVQS